MLIVEGDPGRNSSDEIRIVSLGDLHAGLTTPQRLGEVFYPIQGIRPDLVLLAGDLTHEAEMGQAAAVGECVNHIANAGTLVVSILGNHDYFKGMERANEIAAVMVEAGATFLQGDTLFFRKGDRSVVIVGVCGIKANRGRQIEIYRMTDLEEKHAAYRKESSEDLIRLRKELESIQDLPRAEQIKLIALTHYPPIIDPTLRRDSGRNVPVSHWGSGEIVDILQTHGVDTVISGHVHVGRHKGTVGDLELLNVALPVMERRNYQEPFSVLEV